MMPKKPKVEFRSGGESGNIHWVLSRVRTALQKERRINDYNELRDKVLASGSYTEAISHIRETVDLIDLDGKI